MSVTSLRRQDSGYKVITGGDQDIRHIAVVNTGANLDAAKEKSLSDGILSWIAARCRLVLLVGVKLGSLVTRGRLLCRVDGAMAEDSGGGIGGAPAQG